jgi:hypothetical protein
VAQHETTILENARVRRGPGTSFPYIAFQPSQHEAGEPMRDILPKGYTEVTVVARNTVKSTIDGVSDYWYYCVYKYQYMEYELPGLGWIFGGLIAK